MSAEVAAPFTEEVVTAAPVVPESEDGGRHRVIAVVSPKGGLGKTTLAVNIAVGLARIAPDQVVLVDADVQFGDVAAVLGLEPAHALPDLVDGRAAGDAIVLKTLLTPHPGRFLTVCAAASPVDGERVSGEQLAALVAKLSTVFHHVVVDTAPGLGEHALAALESATDVIAVTGLGVANLRALRSELGVLRRLGLLPVSTQVVVNQAIHPGGLAVKDAVVIGGAPVDLVLPGSKAVPLAANRGVPLLVDAPRDPVSRAVVQLLVRLTGRPPKSFELKKGRA